jgi:hypothetical protein
LHWNNETTSNMNIDLLNRCIQINELSDSCYLNPRWKIIPNILWNISMYNSRILNKQQSETASSSSRVFTEIKLGETRSAEPTKNCWSILYVFWSLGYLNQKRWFNWMHIKSRVIVTRRVAVEQQFLNWLLLRNEECTNMEWVNILWVKLVSCFFVLLSKKLLDLDPEIFEVRVELYIIHPSRYLPLNEMNYDFSWMDKKHLVASILYIILH